MKILKDEVWGIIPARGGSKSIPKKNIVDLGGRPLIEYVIKAAQASKYVTRVICSTDDKEISAVCRKHNVEVFNRPKHLCHDLTPVKDVLVDLLNDIGEKEGAVADILPLLQATSPFILPEQIDKCIEYLKENDNADSSQTVSDFPHNFHAFNQRIIENGMVKFRFSEERKKYYNKQTKPKHYIYGNLIVTRSRTLLEKDEIFGEYSIPLEIPYMYALDVDSSYDLKLANLILKSKIVKLPF